MTKAIEKHSRRVALALAAARKTGKKRAASKATRKRKTTKGKKAA